MFIKDFECGDDFVLCLTTKKWKNNNIYGFGYNNHKQLPFKNVKEQFGPKLIGFFNDKNIIKIYSYLIIQY